ncbi:MAG: PIN domain-containing protein [Anaerolineales bacterium]|nr:PIN domain-containing protein [Anaerolineales bacterium]
MKVIVDTAVWSLALRRGQLPNDPYMALLRELIADGRVVLVGAVRQEILSGIRHIDQFERLKNYLRAFPNLDLIIEDYELAAEFYNTCRHQGVQGANTDFLICAVAARRRCGILTTDKDFEAFSKHIPVILIRPADEVDGDLH